MTTSTKKKTSEKTLAPTSAVRAPDALGTTASTAITTANKATTIAEFSEYVDANVHAQIRKMTAGISPIALSLAYTDWAMHLAVSPGRQFTIAKHAFDLTTKSLRPAWLSQESSANATQQPEHDARFSDDSWAQWPFSAIKSNFKVGESVLNELVKVDGVAKHHSQLVDFFNRQTYDAMSPSNWLLTNPEVYKKGRESRGESIMEGWRTFASDAMKLHGAQGHQEKAGIAPLDFEVGKDVATTKGKVVFKNDLIELIQYAPTTETVFSEPILIVPSCIMKYYILDLSPANSMVAYLVNQGHTVFMISWKNPDEHDRHLGIDDYLNVGIIEAMIAVKECAKHEQIHALGYCLGGTFLAMVAASLANPEHVNNTHNKTPPTLASMILLAAQTDFSEPGELGVYIDADQIKNLREDMAKSGYLSGKQMAASFQFLHARDLLWSKNTRRYLLGQSDVGNDMMSWNTDVTRLPERMHSEYLQSLFLNNDLASGHFRVNGKSIVLKDIQAPIMVVGTTRDHVSPWRSVYKIHLMNNTQTTFMLASGGHNAGIISEPGHPKRSYQIACVEAGHRWIEPNVWSTTTPVIEGSWWEAMHHYLRERSHGQILSTSIAPPTELPDAPGEYVMMRFAD